MDLLITFPSKERGRLDGKLTTKPASLLNKAFCWDLTGHIFPMCVFSSMFLSSKPCYSHEIMPTNARQAHDTSFNPLPIQAQNCWLFQYWYQADGYIQIATKLPPATSHLQKPPSQISPLSVLWRQRKSNLLAKQKPSQSEKYVFFWNKRYSVLRINTIHFLCSSLTMSI